MKVRNCVGKKSLVEVVVMRKATLQIRIVIRIFNGRWSLGFDRTRLRSHGVTGECTEASSDSQVPFTEMVLRTAFQPDMLTPIVSTFQTIGRSIFLTPVLNMQLSMPGQSRDCTLLSHAAWMLGCNGIGVKLGTRNSTDGGRPLGPRSSYKKLGWLLDCTVLNVEVMKLQIVLGKEKTLTELCLQSGPDSTSDEIDPDQIFGALGSTWISTGYAQFDWLLSKVSTFSSDVGHSDNLLWESPASERVT